MHSDIKEKIYCDDDGNKLARDSYYNNHLKSQTHINNLRKGQQIHKSNKLTSSQ